MEEKPILVVDDDDAIRALLLTILKKRGYKVDTARNGVEALERCSQCGYAVMLLDLMMPRLSGLEVLAAMQQRPLHERPVIIVLTAGNDPRNLDPNVVAGAVKKPFDVPILLDMVSGCLSAASARRQPGADPSAGSDGTHEREPRKRGTDRS